MMEVIQLLDNGGLITGKNALFYYFTFDNGGLDLFVIVNARIRDTVERYAMIQR